VSVRIFCFEMRFSILSAVKHRVVGCVGILRSMFSVATCATIGYVRVIEI
jgi:hypothetical protein